MPKVSHTYHCMSVLICAVMTCSDVSVPTCVETHLHEDADILCCSGNILLPSATATNIFDVCLFVFRDDQNVKDD